MKRRFCTFLSLPFFRYVFLTVVYFISGFFYSSNDRSSMCNRFIRIIFDSKSLKFLGYQSKTIFYRVLLLVALVSWFLRPKIVLSRFVFCPTTIKVRPQVSFSHFTLYFSKKKDLFFFRQFMYSVQETVCDFQTTILLMDF